MSQKLATFKIDEDLWEAFKAVALEENQSASEMLKEFVKWVLAGNRLSSTKTPDELENRIDALIEKKLTERLGKHQAA